MIKVSVRNNVSGATVIVEPTTTLRQVFEDNGVNYSRGAITLSGEFIDPNDLDKSFADLGVTGGTAFLHCVAKLDNA